MNKELEEELWTTEKTAEYLKIDPHTVRKLCQQRKLPFIKLTYRNLRFRKSSLDLWLARREQKPLSLL